MFSCPPQDDDFTFTEQVVSLTGMAEAVHIATPLYIPAGKDPFDTRILSLLSGELR
jgi:hypothetical protein